MLLNSFIILESFELLRVFVCGRRSRSAMAYYAAVVSLLELLKEINNPVHPYWKSLLEQHQIVSLYETFSRLQEFLENHPPKLVKETVGPYLGWRIRDATYQAQDIIESHISDWIPQLLVEGSEEFMLDNIVGNKIYEALENVKGEVDSILRELMKIQDVEYLATIKAQLRGESSKRGVISIVGKGGISKTTLARIIFGDELGGNHFDCHAWVTVSEDYHLQNVLLAIVNSLNMNKEELHGDREGELAERIYKHLKGRRYLIIMDDLWDINVWDDIQRILPDDSNGSRVIITTRLFKVAEYTGSSKFTLRMQFQDQSWNLFSEKVFCPIELEDIGRLIVHHCLRLPLAISMVAGLLSKVNKTRQDWGEIARCLESTAIDQIDEHLSNILSLSYNHLPHHLKPCFLYLGGCPEDFEIRVSKLIKLWIAEGFLRPVRSKSLEEVGEEYLEDLVSRGLVLITKKGFGGKFKYCSIHDLLRGFCSQKAQDENFLNVYLESTGHVRRLFVHSSSLFRNHTSNESLSRASSIVLFCDALDHSFPVVLCLKLLRVLDIRKLGISSFPDQIVELLNLRYLALPGTISRVPPSVFKLQKLQTLVIDGSSSLPSEVWKMPHLRHVMIWNVTLPPIPYGERNTGAGPLLGTLQMLGTVVDFTFTDFTVEMIPNVKKLKVVFRNYEPHENAWEKFGLETLIHLHQLETLHIAFSWRSSPYQKVSETLPENFAFPSTLIKLTLEGCKLPWKDMSAVGSLPNLQVLKLSDDAFVGEAWETNEGEFLKLKFLKMHSLYHLKYWRAEDIHFPRLGQLHITECDALEEIPPGIGDILTLQLIEVRACRSWLESSALRIQEEQEELGNEYLQVRVYS